MLIGDEDAPVHRRRKPDGGLRSKFRDALGKKGWQFTPIETGTIVSGVPDAEFCSPKGVTGWIEFKFVSSGAAVGLRPAQVSWIDRRHRLGGRVFVAVEKGGDVSLYDGSGVKELKRHGLASSIGLLYRGRDWDQIRRLLSAE